MLGPLHNVQTVSLIPYFIIILLLTSLAMHRLFISCSEGSECTYSLKNFFSFAYMFSKATVSLSIATFKLKHTRTPAGQYFIKWSLRFVGCIKSGFNTDVSEDKLLWCNDCTETDCTQLYVTVLPDVVCLELGQEWTLASVYICIFMI